MGDKETLAAIRKQYGGSNYGAGYGVSTPSAINQQGTANLKIGPAPKQQKHNIIQGIVTQGTDLAKEAGSAIGHFVANTPKYFYNDVKPFLQGIADTVTGNLNRDLNNQQRLANSLDEQRQTYSQLYKQGKLSKENYIKAMSGIADSYQEISKDAQRTASQADRGNVVQSAFMTGAYILSAGSYAPLEVTAAPVEMGIKDAFQFGAKSGVDNLLTKAGSLLETIGSKNPAIRDLIERNTLKFADGEVSRMAGESMSQYIGREGKNLALGMLIKRPILYQSNITDGEQIYNQILGGNYDQALKGSAWLGSQMIKGGPLGVFYSGAKWLRGTLRKLSYGRQSFIDEISRRIGDGTPGQMVNFIQRIERESPNEAKEVNKVLRILQETNLRANNNDVNASVDSVLNHYVQHGFDLSTVKPEDIYKDMKNWANADELVQKTIKQGLIKNVATDEGNRYVVVRWDTPTKQALANTILGTKTIEEARAAVNEIATRPGVGWSNNRILVNKIVEILDNSKTPEEAAAAIKKIRTASTLLDGVPAKVAEKLNAMGYSIAAPAGGRKTPVLNGIEDTRKLVTGAIKNETENFDPAIAPQPQLAAISGALSHAGLSPTAQNDAANRILGETLVAGVDDLGLAREIGLKNSQGGDLVNGGRAIISKLQTYLENKKPLFHIGSSAAVTDLRQLRYNEIEEALGVTRKQAKQISRAIIDAYTKIPTDMRGAGDKALDYWYAINPFQKYYSRMQSALRYTYNPFFRFQERVETKLLSHAQANNLLWNRSKDELNGAVKILEDSGIFQYGQIGEAAQEIGTGQFAKKGLSRISASMTQGQKRDLAGLAYDIADKMGLTVQQLAIQHPEKVDDALRVVVQYGRKGVLSSPLARTMNMIFFPVRYNLKVTKVAADLLAKQPHAVQLAVIHSLFKMDDYLKSPEGIKWQAQHADALKALNWLLPTNSITQVLNILGINTPLSGSQGYDKFSIGELGQLGGLPFGIISQILDKNHIIQINKPYVDPGTGKVFPDYVPDTAKAQAAQAISDLIGTMFTYPGRTLGLQGKTDILRKLTDVFVNTNSSDFKKEIQNDRLTPLQQQWINVLNGDHSLDAIDALYNAPAEGQFNWYTLPPLRPPVATKLPVQPKSAFKKSGGRGKRKKNYAKPIN